MEVPAKKVKTMLPVKSQKGDSAKSEAYSSISTLMSTMKDLVHNQTMAVNKPPEKKSCNVIFAEYVGLSLDALSPELQAPARSAIQQVLLSYQDV